MRKTNLLMLLGAATLLANLGCNLRHDEKDTVVKVEPEFRVGMLEQLGKTRTFNLIVETYENATCTNGTIQFDAGRDGTTILLDILDIEQPADCIEGDQPLSIAVPYGFLANGTYPLELTIKQAVKNTGILTVTDESYQLSLDSDDGFVVETSETLRVPNRLVWGYVAYHSSQQAQAATDFLSEMETATTRNTLSVGNYGHFKIENGGGLTLNTAPPPFIFFTTFYGFATSGTENIEQQLQNYRNAYPGGEMEFKVLTWEGNSL